MDGQDRTARKDEQGWMERIGWTG
jgi:hypothetical protein